MSNLVIAAAARAEGRRIARETRREPWPESATAGEAWSPLSDLLEIACIAVFLGGLLFFCFARGM